MGPRLSVGLSFLPVSGSLGSILPLDSVDVDARWLGFSAGGKFGPPSEQVVCRRE